MANRWAADQGTIALLHPSAQKHTGELSSTPLKGLNTKADFIDNLPAKRKHGAV
jgi:hypothetical protein